MLGALANISWLAPGQLEKVANALTVTRYEKRSTIFSDKSPSESAYILLSGVARITCDNRKGRRTLVIMVSPGLTGYLAVGCCTDDAGYISYQA